MIRFYLLLFFQRDILFQLPPVIYQIRSLETLWLRYNRIVSVGSEIGRLKRLKMIDLRENKIRELPPTIGQIKSLVVCLLSYNHLRTIPEGLLLFC